MYRNLSHLLLPYTRLELPGWGILLRITHVNSSISDYRWTNMDKKLIKGKLHGYWMELDLSNWSQRLTYFLGRYYELEIQQLMSAVLMPGDRFVDIGANIGMISLHAAYLVTEKGKVDCFEPNLECVEILKNNLSRNDIRHVNVYPVGLSDSNGSLRLSLTSSHSGTATLAEVNESIKSFEVEIAIGDDLVLSDPKQVKMIKIDVEGFELHVLKGLKRSLETFKPMLITEFVESHFQRAGTSGAEIEIFLKELGYKPYGISSHRKWMRYKLHIVTLMTTSSERKYNDILWVHEQTSLGLANKYIVS